MKKHSCYLLIVLLSVLLWGCSSKEDEKIYQDQTKETTMKPTDTDLLNSHETSVIENMTMMKVADIRLYEEWELFMSMRNLSEADFLKLSEKTDSLFLNANFDYSDYQRMMKLLSKQAIAPFCSSLERGVVIITPDQASIDWSFGSDDGIACWVHIETTEEPISEYIMQSAKQNVFALEKSENSSFNQLYYCRKYDDKQKYSKLEFYYGEIDGLFVSVSFARASKEECDKIIDTISFKSIENNPFK